MFMLITYDEFASDIRVKKKLQIIFLSKIKDDLKNSKSTDIQLIPINKDKN